MLVGIDITTFNPTAPRGIAQSVFHLLEYLMEMYPGEIKRYQIDYSGGSDFYPGGIDYLRRRAAQLNWWLWKADKLCRKDKIEVFHSPNFFIPRLSKTRTLAMFSDFFVFTHPHLMPGWYLKPARLLYPLVLKNANLIVTPSEYTRRQILNFFPQYEKKIMVIPHGIGREFRIIDDKWSMDSVKAKYNLPDKFALYTGALDARKNIFFIYDLIRQYYQLHRGSHLGFVIVGAPGHLYKGVPDDLKKFPQIVHTGYVPIEDLAVIYNMADVFIFPSILEGFGIPPLEAMSSGLPVLISDSTALSEISGGGAEIIPLDQPEAWVEGLNRMENDMQWRDSLIAKGREWIKKYSWRESAEKYYRAYESIC